MGSNKPFPFFIYLMAKKGILAQPWYQKKSDTRRKNSKAAVAKIESTDRLMAAVVVFASKEDQAVLRDN
jgi:hypothetical protein